METKIVLINLPVIKKGSIQTQYIFNNDFRFEVGDNIEINCIIHVEIPVGEEIKLKDCTSQAYKIKEINKDCYVSTIVKDIKYNVDKTGVVSRQINVELTNLDKTLIDKYISSEALAENIDFDL